MVGLASQVPLVPMVFWALLMERCATDVVAHLCLEAHSDRNEYNLPTNKEIVVLRPRDADVLQGMRDVLLHLCGVEHHLEHINK